MGDITKVREWVDSDEPEPEGGYDWPRPPICIESVVTGELRLRILARADKAAGSVRLIESEVEAGWSEFTPETYYPIEVKVDGETVWERDVDFSAETAMAAFLKWVG